MTLHVIPIDDERDHTGDGCWCEPKLETKDGDMYYLHNAADCREFCEEVTGEQVEPGKGWYVAEWLGEV